MKPTNVLALILVAAAAVVGLKDQEFKLDLGSLLNNQVKVEAPNLAAPTDAEDLADANKVSELLKGKPEAALALGQIWWGIGDMIKSEDKVIVSTDHIRQANEAVGKLAFSGKRADAAGVSTLVTEGLKERMGGMENKKLSEEDRKAASDYFLALAWGALNAK